ncbi:MAG TPA: DUF4304 domain-containing protein [Archangium sp.]|nr:DUF4304 domain-containing protein [Archangium sp.]
MNSSSNPIRAAMVPALREAGFKVRSNTWHKLCEDTILVVNLQKSQWGPQFYINLAVWVRQLGDASAPKEYQCHIRQRATSLPDKRAKHLERALDLEDESTGMQEREACINEFMRDSAIPFLESLSTMEGIRLALEAQHLKGCFTDRQLKELLARQA